MVAHLSFSLVFAVAALSMFSARRAGAQPSAPAVRRMAIAAHALARGEVLAADDIEFRDTTMRALVDTNQIAVGWITRRAIAAGEVLRSPAVEPPTMITANQSVEVEWKDQNVCLTLRGIATRNAWMGQRVTVRMEYGRRVEGTVVAPGRVRID